jgi:hypothetical protein
MKIAPVRVYRAADSASMPMTEEAHLATLFVALKLRRVGRSLIIIIAVKKTLRKMLVVINAVVMC